ncbi:MAG: hypothetical protein KC636_06225 [Myxococcales bacterium]|nr:hypothetical protein [Myxococcales bacterium]
MDSRLHPVAALRSPLWIGALAALVINDHLLKGAGIVPAPITGKLSDFAGMLVAPALLAVLVRARRREALLLCHLAIAVVFAAINVSPTAAASWSRLMGLVGVPWQITVDPTDLLALPLLLLSWSAFVPVMSGGAQLRPRRLIESSSTAIGVLACVATSPPPDTWEGDTDGELRYTPITADVYIHNADPDDELVVRIRELSPDGEFDCDALESDPGRLVTSALLAPAITWTLPPLTNAAVRDTSRSAPCYAALVESDGLPSAVLFWRASMFVTQEVEGRIDDPSELDDAAVIIDPRALGPDVYESARGIVYPVAIDGEEPTGSCAAQGDGERLAWSEPPYGAVRLTSVEYGVDGCFALRVDDGEGELPPAPIAGSVDWYLCVPEDSFPFVAGDQLVIGAKGGAGVVVRGVDPDTEQALEVHLVRANAPNVEGLSVVAFAAPGCAPALEDTCGTISTHAVLELAFGADETSAEAGQVAHLSDGDAQLDVHVAVAKRRNAVLPSCAEGPGWVGADIEYVAVLRQ